MTLTAQVETIDEEEKTPPQPAQGNIKCPVHGEHGNSSGGKCWYCVSSQLPTTLAKESEPTEDEEEKEEEGEEEEVPAEQQ